jgi:hypothetical protein
MSTLPLTAGVTLLIVLLMFGTAFAVGKGATATASRRRR